MIEQGMYFALGCIVTALAALLFAPVFWHRALRLSRQRLQLQVPLSMQEILADRDGLRAEFAVERLRLEQQLERVHAGKAHDMAEIGRHSMAAAARADELVGLRRVEAAQEREIGLLQRELAETEAEVGAMRKAAHDAFALMERATAAAAEATLAREAMAQQLEARSTEAASLNTRSMGLEMRLVDVERGEAARFAAAEKALRARLETAVAHASRHESSGLSLARDLDEAKATIRRLEADLAAAGAALEAAREREKGIHLQHSLKAEKARGDDRETIEQLAVAREENAALRLALDGARAPRAATPQPPDEAERDLRASIHALGLAVAEMTRQAKAAPEPERVASEQL